MINPLQPNLVVFELADDGQYQTVADVTCDKPFDAIQPFQVAPQTSAATSRVNAAMMTATRM